MLQTPEACCGPEKRSLPGEEFSAAVKDHFKLLAQEKPGILQEIVSVHYHAIKSMSVWDDDRELFPGKRKLRVLIKTFPGSRGAQSCGIQKTAEKKGPLRQQRRALDCLSPLSCHKVHVSMGR